MQEEFDEKVVILVKAEPQPSQQYGETVCCAGLTSGGEWRRLFPIKYRALPPESRFKRWDWLDYRARRPTTDPRRESRHVWEDRMKISGALRPADRPRLLERAMRISVADATARGESLCLIRPAPGSFSFTAKKRGETDIAAELEKRASRLKQQSMLDDPLDPIEPCPFDFRAKFKAGEASHSCDCGDWETDAMFRNFNRALGESAALDAMNETFNTRYPRDGMAIAMGTIASRPKQWTMLGIIRLDRGQRDLF